MEVPVFTAKQYFYQTCHHQKKRKVWPISSFWFFSVNSQTLFVSFLKMYFCCFMSNLDMNQPYTYIYLYLDFV